MIVRPARPTTASDQQRDAGARASTSASATGARVVLEPGVVEVTGVAQLRPTGRRIIGAAEPDGRRRQVARDGMPPGDAVAGRQVRGVATRRAARGERPGGRCGPRREAAVRRDRASAPTCVSTAWSAGHGMSIVRVTLTSRTPRVGRPRRSGRQNVAQQRRRRAAQPRQRRARVAQPPDRRDARPVADADQRRSRSSARGRTTAGTPRCTPPSCQQRACRTRRRREDARP